MISVRFAWSPFISLFAAMIFWASSFIALKIAFQAYDPFVVIFGRMISASICFLFLYKKLKGNTYIAGDWKYLLVMSLSEPCLYFIFEAKALTLTSASQAGMITAVLPLMVALAAGFFLKERVSLRAVIGFCIAAGGVVWLSIGGTATKHAPNPLLGNFYEFLAMASSVAYIIILKHLTVRYNPFFLTALQAFVGSVFFFPLIFITKSRLPSVFVSGPALSILYLGIIVTLLAYGLYNYGVSKIPANQASAYINLIPVFALIMGQCILGEVFTIEQYFASAVVFAGVFISQEWRDKTI